MGYLYEKQSQDKETKEELYFVSAYKPDGVPVIDSTGLSKDEAAARVNYLNGGPPPVETQP